MSHPLDRDALYHCECGKWHYKHEIVMPPCKRGKQKMAGAARKSKLTKYEVIIKRQIEHIAVLEVEARNAEEAVDVAIASADGVGANDWREGDIICQDAKAKVLRDK